MSPTSLDFWIKCRNGEATDRLCWLQEGGNENGEIDYLSLSFAQLRREQDNWGRHLREAGVGRGTRVLLMARPGLPLIAVCFALFKLGAVPIVIDPGMGLRSFSFMCQAITAHGPSRHSFSDMGIEDIPCGISNSYEKDQARRWLVSSPNC